MDNLFVFVIVRFWLLGCAAAIVLALGGCSGGHRATSAGTATAGAAQGPTASFTGGNVPGTVYLGVGPDPVSLDAYRLRGPSSKAKRLTYSPVGLGITGLVANRRDVLIGRTCCDNLKFIELLDLARRGGLPGTVVASGNSVALAPDGRFAHVVPGYRGCRCDALLVRASLFGRDRVVYREPRPGMIVAGAWSASNRLAILVGRSAAYGSTIAHAQIVLDPGTSMQHTIQAEGAIDPTGGIWWGPRGELSYQLEPPRVVIRSPSGQTRSFLLSTTTNVGCWLPNDTIFVLNVTKHTFGTLNPGSGAITTIGRFPSSMAIYVLDCPH